jgi:hypothetical protein
VGRREKRMRGFKSISPHKMWDESVYFNIKVRAMNKVI